MAKGKQVKTSKNKKQSNKFIVIAVLGLAALIALGLTVKGLLSPGGNSAPVTTAALSGDTQVIDMKVTAAGYEPNNIVVKRGVPVKIRTDSTSDAGCVRGFVLPAMGINQALEVGYDEINFVPTEEGQFTFTCQMKMSSGTLTVNS